MTKNPKQKSNFMILTFYEEFCFVLNVGSREFVVDHVINTSKYDVYTGYILEVAGTEDVEGSCI